MTCTAARHGNVAAYDHHGCRCPGVTRLKTMRRKRNEQLRLDGHGTYIYSCGALRRLQALACMGWGLTDLAAETGLHASHLNRLRRGYRDGIWRPTHDTIAAVYDRLSLTYGPSHRSRTWARKQGWAPPLAWDDDEIDDPKARPRGVRWDVAS